MAENEIPFADYGDAIGKGGDLYEVSGGLWDQQNDDNSERWADEAERDAKRDAELAIAFRQGDLMAQLSPRLFGEGQVWRRAPSSYVERVKVYRWVEHCMCDGYGRGPHRCPRIDYERSYTIEVNDPGNDGEYAFGPAERMAVLGPTETLTTTQSVTGVYSFQPDRSELKSEPGERRRIAQETAARHRERRLNHLRHLIMAFRFFEKSEGDINGALHRYWTEWSGVRTGDPAHGDPALVAMAEQAREVVFARHQGIADLAARLREQEEQDEARLRSTLKEGEYWLLQLHRAGTVPRLEDIAPALGCSIATAHRMEKKLRTMGLIASGRRREGVRGAGLEGRFRASKSGLVSVTPLSQSRYAEPTDKAG